MEWKRFSFVLLFSILPATVAHAGPVPEDRGDLPSDSKPAQRQARPQSEATVPADQLSPIPVGVEFARREFTLGVKQTAEAEGGDPAASQLIYSNTLGKFFLGTSLGGVRIADGIVTRGADGCILDRLVTTVTGDRNGLGADLNEPFSVTVALYPTCPGADSSPTPLTGFLSDGTEVPAEAIVSFPDGGMYELVVDFPGMEIALPSSFYFAVRFGRPNVGIAAGGLPTLGHSSDRFDYPGLPCRGTLGAFPAFPHGSFDFQVYVREPCAMQFAGYHSERASGDPFTEGPLLWFADDITLDVPDCRMTAIEVRAKGKYQNSSGAVQFDLKTSLDDIDPEEGNRIPGTRTQAFLFRDALAVARQEFADPISLPQSLWITFRTTSDVVGPIATVRTPSLGSTAKTYFRYWGTPPNGEWAPATLPLEERLEEGAGFDVTIFCEGSPPSGACCDMVFTDDENESVCRAVPLRNCAQRAPRWVSGAVCEDVCVGGINHGQPCTRQADCPGGDCPGPFAHACGVAACCEPDDTCENLTSNECDAIEPIEVPRFWSRTQFCDEDFQECPFNACLRREGDCAVVHPEPGCEDPFCCHFVCNADAFCCTVSWDRECLSLVPLFCPRVRPANDECFDLREGHGALIVGADSSTVSDGLHATENEIDPGFCCNTTTPEAQGLGTVWYKFVARHDSARLDTLLSDPPARDSLIQIFAAGDATTDETACNSLTPMACNDNALDIDPPDNNSSICVGELIRGETYYVMVAAKRIAAKGQYRLTIQSPCDRVEPPANDECANALPAVEGATPFDLTDATIECPNDVCGGPFINDVWFDYVAESTGVAVFSTCRCDFAVPQVSLAIYEGCDCVPSADTLLACQESGVLYGCCGSLETPGIEPLSVTATTGQCLKVRLGAHGLDGVTGFLDIKLFPPLDCPVGEIEWIDPPNGVVDARRPHPSGSFYPKEGIRSLLVSGPAGLGDERCWSVCESRRVGPPENQVTKVVDNNDGTFSIILDQPIAVGLLTTVIYTDDGGNQSAGRFASHPGNVIGDGLANEIDLIALRLVLEGEYTAPWGRYSTDCDHSGVTTPIDLLCVIDLLNGGDTFAPGWMGTPKPLSLGPCSP